MALLAQSGARRACGQPWGDDDHGSAGLEDARSNRVGQPWRPVRIAAHAGCPGNANTGNAYAGGFHLRSPSACVPLIFAVGAHRATIEFGIGKRCR